MDVFAELKINPNTDILTINIQNRPKIHNNVPSFCMRVPMTDENQKESRDWKEKPFWVSVLSTALSCINDSP